MGLAFLRDEMRKVERVLDEPILVIFCSFGLVLSRAIRVVKLAPFGPDRLDLIENVELVLGTLVELLLGRGRLDVDIVVERDIGLEEAGQGKVEWGVRRNLHRMCVRHARLEQNLATFDGAR